MTVKEKEHSEQWWRDKIARTAVIIEECKVRKKAYIELFILMNQCLDEIQDAMQTDGETDAENVLRWLEMLRRMIELSIGHTEPEPRCASQEEIDELYQMRDKVGNLILTAFSNLKTMREAREKLEKNMGVDQLPCAPLLAKGLAQTKDDAYLNYEALDYCGNHCPYGIAEKCDGHP